MKFIFTCIFLLGCIIPASAQFIPPAASSPNMKPAHRDPFDPLRKKHRKYKRNTWKYLYNVKLKSGNSIEANSDILTDPTSGKSFLYYSEKDSLQKIFPEETQVITRPNPFNIKETVEGYPTLTNWRFTVLKGHINAFCFFAKGREINEIQIKGAEALPFDPELLKSVILNSEKAMKAFEIKDYYNAIRIFNEENKG